MSSPLYFFPSSKRKNLSFFSCIKCPQPQEINSCIIYREKGFHSIKFNILCTVDKACSFQMTDRLTTIHHKRLSQDYFSPDISRLSKCCSFKPSLQVIFSNPLVISWQHLPAFVCTSSTQSCTQHELRCIVNTLAGSFQKDIWCLYHGAGSYCNSRLFPVCNCAVQFAFLSRVLSLN